MVYSYILIQNKKKVLNDGQLHNLIYLICNNKKKIYFLNVFSQIIRVVSIFSKLPFRGIATNRVTFNGGILSCWKNTIYQNTVVKSDETSTYQELDISENAYQITTIR